MRHADCYFTIGCDCRGLLKNDTCPCKPKSPRWTRPSLTWEDLPRHFQRYRSLCFGCGIISRASELEKRTPSFEESLPGALKLGNLQKKSGEKEREPQGCLAGLFLVNVMENAKSLSCSPLLPLFLSLSFSLSCWLVLCCRCGIADFPGLNQVKRPLCLYHWAGFWDIWSQCAGSCPALLKNAVGGTLDPPKRRFNT